MKKSIYYLITVTILVIVVFSSCELIDDILEIDFNPDFKEIPVNIEPSDAGLYTFVDKEIMSDLADEISDNGGSIEDLRKVTLDSAYIEVEASLEGETERRLVEIYKL